MNIDALIQYGVLSLGLVAALVLFVALKREIGSLAQRHQRHIEEMETRLGYVETNAKARMEEPAPVSAVLPTTLSGFNLTHRTQALRLLRRGEDVSHVAAALGVPRAEVELLIRVQKLGATRLAGRP